MSEIPEIEIKKLKLKSLKNTVGNPQVMDEDVFNGLVESIRKNGWLLDDPVIWDNNGEYQIISGHHRIAAAIKAGIKDKDCKVISGITELQARKLVLEANERRGDIDEGMLKKYIKQLQDDFKVDIGELKIEVGIDNEIFSEMFNNPEIQKEELKPYRKSHILLSFEPALFIKIQEYIDKIMQIDGIEIEQSSN